MIQAGHWFAPALASVGFVSLAGRLFHRAPFFSPDQRAGKLINS